jgi:glycosyltransferase involved in cell wall biosynthesis
MLNVGILTEKFIEWGGGIDFIRLILNGLTSLNSNTDNVEVNIYILIKKRPIIPTEAKNCLKILINKIYKKKYVLKNNINRKQIINDLRKINRDIVICTYTNLDSSLISIVRSNNLDVILPVFTPLHNDFPIPWVGYIFDFQHKYYPHYFQPKDILYRDSTFRVMLDKAKIVIVNSNAVIEDISRFIGNTNSKVISLPFCPILDPDILVSDKNMSSKYNLTKSYFIISNQFWKHKDHITAIKAFKLFLNGQPHKNILLVCTGKTIDQRFPEYFNQITSLVVELNLTQNILFLGYLPKQEQLLLLKNSIAVIQPTLFEGGPGGFAVYDAISLGIPSIVSDIAVNLELTDSSVTFFKNQSPEDLAEKMNDVFKYPKDKISDLALIQKNKQFQITFGKVIFEILSNSLHS